MADAFQSWICLLEALPVHFTATLRPNVMPGWTTKELGIRTNYEPPLHTLVGTGRWTKGTGVGNGEKFFFSLSYSTIG